MTRRPRLFASAALVAALFTAGCIPLVSEQRSSQQDLIGDVDVSANVCTAPQLGIFLGLGFPGGGPWRASETLRTGKLPRTARGIIGGPVDPVDPFACPDEETLEEWLDDASLEEATILGLPHQILVAYRVPAGAEAPESFQASARAKVTGIWQGLLEPGETNEPEIDLAFRRAPEMDDQLVEFYDEQVWSGLPGAPDVLRDGDQVVGYISSPVPGPLLGDVKLTATFGLPGGTATQPYGGPFNALTMAGTRIALSEEDLVPLRRRTPRISRALRVDTPAPTIEDIIGPNRPVDCDLDLPGLPDRGGPPVPYSVALCPVPTVLGIGSPEELAEEAREAVKGVDLNTRDLRVLGGEGFAEQGATASVPFTLRGAGASSATQLGLSAASALAGATATPTLATTPFPGAGDHGRSVTVQIPDNAVPGTYDVTLTATVGGERRTGTGRVVVLPKPAAASSSFSSAALRGRDNVYMDRDGNIAFGWICPPACGNNRVDVTSPKAGIAPKANTAAVSKPRLLRIARGKFKAANAKRARVKVRLFPRARKAVRKGRAVKAIIVVRTGGKGVPSVRRVTIKLRKPKR